MTTGDAAGATERSANLLLQRQEHPSSPTWSRHEGRCLLQPKIERKQVAGDATIKAGVAIVSEPSEYCIRSYVKSHRPLYPQCIS